jgi:hypothetical protein
MRWKPVLVLVLLTTLDASAQTVTPAKPSIERHQVLSLNVAGMSCTAGQANALFDDDRQIEAKPATAPTTWTVATDDLPAGPHTVKMKCGDVITPAAPIQVTAARPMVVAVRNLTPKEDDTSIVRMGDGIAVDISGFQDWEAAHRDATTRQAPPLHLFIDGTELSNLALRQFGTDPAKDIDTFTTTLVFDSTTTRASWVQALWAARRSQDAVKITAGGAGGPAFTSNTEIKMNIYRTSFFGFSVIVVLGLIALTLYLAVKTPALRDGPIDSPFSLARHQMAVWFVIVVSAYMFVSATTGATAAVSPTALVLIGISGATGLVAITIDKNKQQALETERATIEKELNDPVTGLLALQANAAPGPAAQAVARDIAARNKRLLEIAQQLNPTSKGWWRDLLSDGDGISFHRLQMLTWTVVFAGIFLRAVWRDLAMPEFDATTLGLMGISSGTYLGFKLPENQ